jgi:hypothetical protein
MGRITGTNENKSAVNAWPVSATKPNSHWLPSNLFHLSLTSQERDAVFRKNIGVNYARHFKDNGNP